MRRLTALDGLRGVAAAIVVVYHLSLVAQPYLDSGTVGDPWWWVSASPFKIFTAGSQGVLVFFVLSGLVVAIPAMRKGFAWSGYYVTRLLRLYVPVWAALALAAAFVILLPRDPSVVTANSWIADTNATTTTVAKWFSDASLTRVGYDLDNVLWSLRWEVIFSVTLPAFLGVALLLRKAWLIGVLGSAALSAVGSVIGNSSLTYLPLFLMGTIGAVHLDDIRRWASARTARFWLWLTIASLVVVVLGPVTARILPSGSIAVALFSALAGFGAAGLVLCALCAPAWDRALSTPVPQFLGRISFSLYLVHVPIIATTTYLLGDQRWWLVAIITIPLSVTVAWLFHNWVEKPSHRLAKTAGRQRGMVLSGGTS
ncbi:MAG: acyltransferase [Glaciihabitans sp.]|jgi:peptidoglycan/LPS O-acetylase OafA/YrhL|nr:acyltransferase [Glaciihabitans sp.]MDQ1570576.1 hypothetical protein [Actinomycetota bacterium]